MSRLEDLGREVARQQDHALEQDGAVDSVRSLLRHAPLVRQRRVGPWLAAAAVVLLVGGALAWRSSLPIGIETADVHQAQWVEAASERSISFSDGATVLLRPGARAQVSELTAHGAEVALERGEASISVPHRGDTRWRFRVGPYAIRVVGTRFDTGWNPSTEAFMLRLHDGAVQLSGPNMADQKVVAGQVVTLSLAPSKVLTPEPEPLSPADSLRPRVSPGPRGARAEVWRVLANAGRYDEALAAAKHGGAWSRLTSAAPADDLLLLGDIARLAHDRPAAQLAYDSARKRFSGSTSAAVAAFSLGRLAFDAHDDALAARWFEQYRAERPTGGLAPEALGRQVELAQRTGNTASANRLAQEYLVRYPDGAHARLAKGQLGQ